MPTGKNLIYFTIGGGPSYTELLKYCIKTIKDHPANNNYDILVMCDRAYKRYVEKITKNIIITADNPDNRSVSRRKLEIFDYLEKTNYDKVLYLDCDIVVTGELSKIFDVIEFPGLLYVVPENGTHNNKFWSLPFRPYNARQLLEFHDNEIPPFNSGQFCFINHGIILLENMFKEIRVDMDMNLDKDWGLYEQGYLNYWFNTSRNIDYSIAELVDVSCSKKEALDKNKIIHHFADYTMDYRIKLQKMKTMYEKDRKPIKEKK